MGKTNATQTLAYNTASLNNYLKKVDNSFAYKTPAGVAAPRLVVAGVLSGRNLVDNGVPFTLEDKKVQPEHYTLIIGHEPGSNRYIFWDSDYSESNIESSGNQLGEGFACCLRAKLARLGSERHLVMITLTNLATMACIRWNRRNIDTRCTILGIVFTSIRRRA